MSLPQKVLLASAQPKMYTQNAYELKQSKASSDENCSPRLMLQAFQKNQQKTENIQAPNPPMFYNGKNQNYLQGNQQLAISSKLKPTQNTVHYSQMNLADIHALEQQQKYMQSVNQNFTTVTAAVGGQIASNQQTRDKVMKNVIHFNQSSKSANSNQQTHQTLQCLSQIDQFKQKVNMVLQSQAFPGNQNTGVFQNQKYSLKEGQGIVPGQKIGQNIVTGDNTPVSIPSAMVHKNEIDLVQEQKNFLAWKNQLKSNPPNIDRVEQAQLENVLSNQQLISSKDQKKNNVYQHLNNNQASEDQVTPGSNSLMATPSGARSQNQQSMVHQHINQSIQNGHLYSNSYVQNNLKQQQRRKLLLEYSQENHVLNQEIKSSQQQRNKKNMSHGGSETVSREKDPMDAQSKENETPNELIESLKKLDITALEDKEREKLRFLSLQYQFHLQQYEEQHQIAYNIQPIAPSKKYESNQPSNLSLKSTDIENSKQQTVSRMMRLNSQVEGGLSGPVSDYHQGKSFQSDRFIENEKNLSEDRLKKQAEERDPLPVVNQFQIKNSNNSELNQKTPNKNKENGKDITLDQTQQLDLQGSQSDSNLKKSFNNNGIKKQDSQYMSAKQTHENDGMAKTGPETIKALFSQDSNKFQSKEIQSIAVNSLQSFIENLSLGDKKKSNVLSLQNHQIQLQEPDTSSSSKGKGNLRQNEVANLYNKYNKVYQQVDHHKNGAGYLRKSEGFNCPKPTPQQILNMNNSSQRLNLFKILQAKEHIKFQNIQNEKIQQLQTLQEQQELSSSENPKQFMDFIQRKQGATKKGVFTVNQYQQKQLQNLKNIQQLKTLQKQQLNDQKAFGIFQMNELAQFKSMSDQNQKQILLNNLQQGKFEDLDQELVTSPPKQTSVQRSLQNDQSQRFHQQSRAQNIQSRENQNQKLDNDYQQLSPNSNIEKTIEIKVNELNKNMYQPQIMQQAKLNQSVFDNTTQNYATEDNQSKKFLQQSLKGSIAESIAEIQVSEPNSAQPQDVNVQQSLHVIRNPQLNQIQRRYEESKFQFEVCLRETISKQQIQLDQIGEKTRFSKGGVNIDNILPGFSQRLVNGGHGSEEKPEDKYRTRIKTRAGISMSNTNKNANKLKISCGKEDEKNGLGPESSKNADPKKLGDKDGTKEEGKEGEEPAEKVEGVKRVPKYFPPRKMPNPFEEQANEQDRFMQARKEALAKYSNISKNRFKQDERDPLKYVIKPGNNSKLIMRVLEKSGRLEPKGYNPGWEAADDNMDSLYNFKWKPTSAGLKYDLISKHGLKQVVNHVKGHYQITTKDNLFLNMKSYYESQKQNVFDIVPLTIVIDYLKDDVGEKMETFMHLHKLIEKNINEDFEEINKKMAHFQQAKEKSIKTTYKINRCCQSGENLWLLKPTGFNRGIGIHIFQTFDQLREIMSESYGIGRGKRDKMSIFQTHNHNHIARGDTVTADNEKEKLKSFTFVIQKLIEKPLLYMNRKFDIRVWAILNSYDGKFYCFKESYVRTSSKEYKQYDPDVPNDEQIFMQLTNNAVQNTGEEYGKYEEGNITSCDTLFRHVSETEFGQGKTKHELLADFNAKKNKQMIDSIKSIKGKITHQKHTFELFGYDFILDEDLNTVLIEVNTNPCLEESNNLLKHMLPRMVDDCLNIMMDPIFANGSGTENAVNRNLEKYKSAFALPGEVFVVDQKEKPSGDDMHPGYKIDENLFEQLYTMEM